MANNSTLKKIQIDNVTYDIGGGASVAVQNNTALVINNSGTDTTEIANTIAANPSAEATESLNKIKIGDVVYVIESSQPSQPSGVTIYTLIPPCTAVPIDSTTMIENVYFNTSLSEAEVISIMDNAFASVPGWLEEVGPMAQVFMKENYTTIIAVVISDGMYIIQGIVNNPDPQPEEAVLFIGGPNASAMGLGFTGWNPSFNGSLVINETNAYMAAMFIDRLEQFQQMNEALKELISSTPF